MIPRCKYETTETMELCEFVEYAKENIDTSDQDQLYSLGEQLTKLGNNRDFLANHMGELIKATRSFDRLNEFVPQSIVLARTDDFYLRANFWLPRDEITDNEVPTFAYHVAHDHNFNLLTYGYCGAGYETDVFEYNYKEVAGYLGEQVKVIPLGRLVHGCGETMMYRCNIDIHLQLPPASPSITLNVIPLHTQGSLRDQYFFDITSRDQEVVTLSKYVQSPIDSRRKVFEMIKNLSFNDEKHIDSNLLDLVFDFAINHPCRRTRFHALETLSFTNQEAHKLACEKLRDDKSLLVRHYITSAGY